MGLREILILGAIFGAAYWYYDDNFSRGGSDLREAQWEINRRAMADCMDRESRLATIAGNAGVTRNTSNAQGVCAEELGLYWEDGRWNSF
ncbi:hypothetical protein EY643_14630 [Halioglobus maricola]|uniref:Uncharacterized protein n=1 Tax=Halioglobus maricola TaxID=2601894 RepID=A0A5P9NMQ6_9GAMM|nr:hypothetical protein [Halioglobus maricola]QFU76786.1 hypothetical protein EY643_14630 [Halioglobus maricola]